MARFSTITCDHCDARDILEYPSKNGIKSYYLRIVQVVQNEPINPELKSISADLCDSCFAKLDDVVFTLMTQQPKSTGF